MKILFACDLDNTLIHSSKHKRKGDICVEKINGNEQSFISPKTYELLKKVVKEVIFVPVTTRSVEQYNRIEWESDIMPKFAITTNGAMLFQETIENDEWNEESKIHALEYKDELNRLLNLLLEKNNFIRCRMVDDRYLFAYFKPEINIEEFKEEYRNYTNLKVQFSGRKMYIFPEYISKGYAVQKFKDKINADILICAGDSTIDFSMFPVADISYAPNTELIKDLPKNTKEKIICCKEEKLFSEFILEDILEKVKNTESLRGK